MCFYFAMSLSHFTYCVYLFFVYFWADLLQKQRCSLTICFNLRHIAAEGFHRSHLKSECREKFLFEIGQNLKLSALTGHVLTKGIYSIEQWQLTRGSKEAEEAEDGTSKER